MLGVDNYIVKSDNITELTKAVKDVFFDETEDKCNQKSEKVRQRVHNDFFPFGGRKEKFKASRIPFIYTQAYEVGDIRFLVTRCFTRLNFAAFIKSSSTFSCKNLPASLRASRG